MSMDYETTEERGEIRKEEGWAGVEPLEATPPPVWEEDRIEEILDIPEVSSIEDLGDEEYTPEERRYWQEQYLSTVKSYKAGELVKGRIVAISEKEVTVDIGFKSEGTIPITEFPHPEAISVGDEIEVYIESVEGVGGAVVLSRQKAEFMTAWEKIQELYRTGETVQGQIVRRVKGGMVVNVLGVEAFLPGSQIFVHPVRDFDALVGMPMDFRIIKLNETRKNIVVSHKVLEEEALKEVRAKVLAELEEGMVVEGTVKNITDFGVFVDLGGVDGLLHITDLSWTRINHPSEVVQLDQKIKVKVLHYDKEKQRISLGLKQLHEPDWTAVEEKYPVGSKVKGKVVAIMKYGVFVELEPGIEGLVHISEMSWTQHIRHPSQLVSVGDEVEVVVLNVDTPNHKISLGMKQIEADPWERLEATYTPGSRHKGVVKELLPFGAFVELEPGIDGLIHISDLSWTRKVRHPGEIVKKGEEIEVVILSFDRNERRISLGLKQLEEDPWERLEAEFQIHSHKIGKVVRVLERGVVVSLPGGVEGFVPNSQLGKSYAGENKRNLKEGEELELEVIEFDRSSRRIVLSQLNVERAKERAAYEEYLASLQETKVTVGDILKAKEGEEVIIDIPGAEAARTSRKKKVTKKSEEESITSEVEGSPTETSEKVLPPTQTEGEEDSTKRYPIGQAEGEPVTSLSESSLQGGDEVVQPEQTSSLSELESGASYEGSTEPEQIILAEDKSQDPSLLPPTEGSAKTSLKEDPPRAEP